MFKAHPSIWRVGEDPTPGRVELNPWSLTTRGLRGLQIDEAILEMLRAEFAM